MNNLKEDKFICMVICHFDSTNASGGLERQAALLANHLAADGHRVVVISSTRDWKRRGWRERDNFPVRYFWTYASPQVSGRFFPAALVWAVQVFLWIALNRRRLAVVHGHQIRVHAFAGALANYLWKIPHILKSASGGSGADIRTIGSRKYFFSIGRRFIVKNTDVFVAMTQTIRDDLIQFGVPDSKIAIIPNGMVMPAAGREPRIIEADERRKRFVFLGRLSRDKHVLQVAKSGLQVFRGCKEVRLGIFGKGQLEREMCLLIADSNSVRYFGYIDDPVDILSEYGFLLLPSDVEGLSNVMIEAMACGVVPITTRVSGCVDHLEEGVTGFFMENSSEESIKAEIECAIDLSAEQWLAMSLRVSRYARERFDINVACKAYATIYARL